MMLAGTWNDGRNPWMMNRRYQVADQTDTLNAEIRRLNIECDTIMEEALSLRAALQRAVGIIHASNIDNPRHNEEGWKTCPAPVCRSFDSVLAEPEFPKTRTALHFWMELARQQQSDITEYKRTIATLRAALDKLIEAADEIVADRDQDYCFSCHGPIPCAHDDLRTALYEAKKIK
jgi:hypothetical protein